MERTLLIIANFVAYLLFITTCFTLIEGMLYGKHYGILFRLLIGIVNAGLMVFMALNVPINLAYLITLVVLFAELLIIFRKSMKDTLFVSVAIMMNIMCLRGMVVSLFALVLDGTLYSVYSNDRLFLRVLLTTNILEWLAVDTILRFVRMESLRFTMQNKTQARYINIWASLCVLFMFRSSVEYVRDFGTPDMFIDHLCYCFILLLSFYYLLGYTFRLNRVAHIQEINKNLNKALGNQIELQSALMRDAVFTAKANLTKNTIINGNQLFYDPLDSLSDEYDVWFGQIESKIHPDDWGIFYQSLKRQNLLDSFHRGIEPRPFEYRRLGLGNNYRWLKLILRMFKDVESDDVYVFGYAFDVENEVLDRQALVHGAQTDLFTGLYNKSTTETLIGEEIRKGAGILFLIDIDDFKNINDRFGHEAGDCVLKYFSDLITSIFRKVDIIGRVGGDEFMIYVKDKADSSIAADKASEILIRLITGVDYDETRIIVNASIGIAVIDEENYSFSEAYNQADSALYEAKSGGKNGYVIYGDKEQC